MVIEASDRQLIDACKRGDYDAFAQLFESYKDRVYSIALRFSADPAAAMDIAQDAFLKLFSRIKDFRGESSFESWLFKLVVNSCLDQARRRRRLMPFVESLIDLVRSPSETALQHLMRAETEAQVQKVIARLPEDQRIVVVLRYTEGLSYDEIAQIVGCSKGTVGSRLNRAHKTLERRLAHLRPAAGSLPTPHRD
jgi:RNA polymerase sigma-70 factor (ECF subfamily)